LTGGLGVNIIDTSESQDFLGDLSGNTSSSSWGWHESNAGGTTFASNLDWDGMDTTNLGTPITSSDWDDVALGVHKSTLNGNLDFLSDLDSDTNVTLSVSASDNSLESGSLSGLGLLLDGENAHDLIGELVLGVGEESISNLIFLDWDRESVNFFEGFNLSGLDKSSELGDWGPLVLVEATSASWSTSTSSSSSSSTSSISSSESSSSSS